MLFSIYVYMKMNWLDEMLRVNSIHDNFEITAIVDTALFMISVWMPFQKSQFDLQQMPTE